MAKAQTLRFKRSVNAPAAAVYRAFTNSTALREWFCDAAQAEPRKGGRLYVAWNSGFYANGEFTALTPPKKIGFTWHGRGEPEETRVQVSLAEKNGVTMVTLTHGGIGPGKTWARLIKGFTHGWEVALESLQWVLETGQDLRLVRRPLLGINGGDFNPEIAANLGVPVTEGLRLDGVADGKGAQAAGLQRDDVIVSLGGKKVSGLTTLITALRGRRAGDKVQVVFYRGAEKKTATMELSARSLYEVPMTPAALADAVKKKHAENDAELARYLQGVSEAEAGCSPASGEWSAKETLAHLIICERDTQTWIGQLITDAEPWSEIAANQTNLPSRIHATISILGTVPALIGELECSEKETLATLAALPPEFVAHKGTYWRMGYFMFDLADHTVEHLKQMCAAIEAARKQ